MLCFKSPLVLKSGLMDNCKHWRGGKEECDLKLIVMTCLFTSVATKSKRAQHWRKMEVISDVKTLPWEHYCFGHWPFYKFQYSSLLHRSLVFLRYSFTKPDGVSMETTRHQDLNFALTWNLFRFHIQVGCCFPADALRLTRRKSTHCLEFSGGGKGGPQRQKKRERDMRCFCFFSWHWNGILTCETFRALTTESPVCWGARLVVLFPHG